MILRPLRLVCLAFVPFAALACGSTAPTQPITMAPDSGGTGPQGGDSGGTTPSPDGSSPTDDNSTPVVVNMGPAGSESVNVPFVSITICVPGTTNCQTIDSISVDTGSSGLRIISSVLSKSLALPLDTASTGQPMAECFAFDDGYTWGSVRLVDLKVGGETATKIPIQLIGDPAYSTVPSDCSMEGTPEDTVQDFGGNGLIGINQIVPDCGEYCSDTNQIGAGAYYSCSSAAACAAVAVPNAAQIANPIAAFPQDNNGALLTFPTVPAAGEASLTGTLTFGIGTQSNNALGSATIQTVDQYGNFTTIYKGATLDTSFIDSGTNSLSFNDSSITQCPAELSGFLCPASPFSGTAQNKGLNGATTTVPFGVESALTLFNNESFTAFDDLGTTGIDNNTFDWGFPFFIGRTVFVGLDGATTPGGKGPFVAY